MNKYKFEVTFADDSTQIAVVDQRDIRRWESEKGESWLTNDLSLTATAEIAFYAFKRTGEYSGSWADFDASVVWVREVEDETAGPTPKKATAARSSRSRSAPKSE